MSYQTKSIKFWASRKYRSINVINVTGDEDGIRTHAGKAQWISNPLVSDKEIKLVLKDRPANLIPSWESESDPPVSEYMDFEIESDLHLNVSQDSSSSHSDIAEHSGNEADESDIEVVTSDQSQEALYDIDADEQARMHALLQMNEHDGEPGTTDQNEAPLYDIDQDEQARMHALIERAMSNQNVALPDERRVTRSSGRKFEWNSAMNEGDVVLEKKD